MVRNRYLSDSAKTQKSEGRVVIHHLNDDQKALVIRYCKKYLHKYLNCWEHFPLQSFQY